MDHKNQALAFYLKYFDIMEQLYIDESDDNDDAQEGDDAEDNFAILNKEIQDEKERQRVADTINQTGRIAYEQAADILYAVAKKTEQSLGAFCKIKIKNHRKTIKQTWNVDMPISPNDTRELSADIMVGAYLDGDKRGLACCLWAAPGFEHDLHEVAKVAFPDAKGSKEFNYVKGTIILECIPIPPNVPGQFHIDSELLVKNAVGVFDKVTPDLLEKLWKVFANSSQEALPSNERRSA